MMKNQTRSNAVMLGPVYSLSISMQIGQNKADEKGNNRKETPMIPAQTSIS